MAAYYIIFSGECKIEAESYEEAERLFWDTLQKPCEAGSDDVYDINAIVEAE